MKRSHLPPITNIEVESLVISIGEDIPFSCLINNQSYTSDGSGILLIEQLLLDQQGSSIFIQSDGYYDEIRYVIPALNANLYLEVTMTRIIPENGISKDIEGFNASDGGIVDAYKTIITFEPNTIVDEEGNLYEGEVNVFASYTYFAAFLHAIRRFPHNSYVEDRKHKTLNIVGGHNLLLRDEMMNPLYLKEGSSAEIRFKVPASSDVTIPDVLDMMAYDVESDKWISMGNAEKEGEEWTGHIDNLGIIAWGVAHESRIAQLKLVTEEGIIVPNKFVWLFTTDMEIPYSLTFSDSDGNVRIHVPIDKEYLVRIYEHQTPNFLLGKEYPIVEKWNSGILNLDDFVVTSELYQVYNGSVIGCQSDIILNSAIIGKGPIEFGTTRYDAYVFSDEKGMFNYAYPNVNSNQIGLKAYNFDLGHTSQEYFIDNNDEVTIEFGDLLVCE